MLNPEDIKQIQEMSSARDKQFSDALSASQTMIQQQAETIKYLEDRIAGVANRVSEREQEEQTPLFARMRIPTPLYYQDAGVDTGTGASEEIELPGVPYVDGTGRLVATKYTLTLVNGRLTDVAASTDPVEILPAGASGAVTLSEVPTWSVPTLAANGRALTIVAGRITAIGGAVANTIDTAVVCPNAT